MRLLRLQLRLGVTKIAAVGRKLGTVLASAEEATSIRRLSFADENIAHEEPIAEELPGDAEPSVPRKPRRKVAFEKTAGARATRSNNPEKLRNSGDIRTDKFVQFGRGRTYPEGN